MFFLLFQRLLKLKINNNIAIRLHCLNNPSKDIDSPALVTSIFSSSVSMMSSEPSGDREYQGRFHPTMDFELMNSYRLSGVLCDVTIMVKGIEFPAHKLVLAVNSPYFRATFASDFESHADHTLECDPSAFGAILNTLYSGIMMMITPDTAQDILEAASMLNISRVMENCCQVLELNMDTDNCLDLL